MSRIVLRSLLATLGMLLARASRRSAGFRAALSRERTIAIETGDGVAYRFSVRARKLSAARGVAPDADFKLHFSTSREALGFLLAKDGLDRLLDGTGRGSISMRGNLMLFLWFQGRLEEASPVAALRHHRIRFPGAYTAPRDDIEAARWIRREPVAEALDPGWPAAAHQRERLLMMRVAAGEKAPEF